MLKIQYKEYDQKMMGRAELCDTVLVYRCAVQCAAQCSAMLVCRDGRMLASGLLFGSLSAFLRQALHSRPQDRRLQDRHPAGGDLRLTDHPPQQDHL
jgi:hypothetical protein